MGNLPDYLDVYLWLKHGDLQELALSQICQKVIATDNAYPEIDFHVINMINYNLRIKSLPVSQCPALFLRRSMYTAAEGAEYSLLKTA